MGREPKKFGAVDAGIASAVDSLGRGVAYARVRSPRGERVVRVPFSLPAALRTTPRAADFAAVQAVADDLARRGVRRLTLRLDDPEFVAEAGGRGSLPSALVLPYVRLRCALNAFERCRLTVAPPEIDLQARARAEVAVPAAA